jgi:hypothetical protein
MIIKSKTYWDCACEHHSVHPHSCKRCEVCGKERDDQLSSRVQGKDLTNIPYSLFHVCEDK